MGWVDALSFATETMTTVGYGDFHLWTSRCGCGYEVVLMLSGIGMISVTVAFIADVLLSRRLSQAANRQLVSHLRRHFVVVGLGSFGVRVASMLRTTGTPSPSSNAMSNRYISEMEQLNPVIVGDATLPDAGRSPRRPPRAVAVLTEDDMVNIETGLVLRQMTGSAPGTGRRSCCASTTRRSAPPSGHRLDFNHVRSTVDLATVWFIGGAMGWTATGAPSRWASGPSW